MTASFGYVGFSDGAPRHALMTITGGAIGYGMPCAVGAALAAPGRKVIDFQADGSALYTVQALWTQGREGLDITTLICSNKSYRILEMEFARAGMNALSTAARALTSLSCPDINWVEIAWGFGVPAVSVDTSEALADELNRSLSEGGPLPHRNAPVIAKKRHGRPENSDKDFRPMMAACIVPFYLFESGTYLE